MVVLLLRYVADLSPYVFISSKLWLYPPQSAVIAEGIKEITGRTRIGSSGDLYNLAFVIHVSCHTSGRCRSLNCPCSVPHLVGLDVKPSAAKK